MASQHEQRSGIDRIEHNFTYHPPKPEQQVLYEQLRVSARDFALLIHELTIPSREQSLALTSLEETVMWANASIARNQ